MKWLIASDIHGSEYFCTKLVQAFEKEQCDKILLLGDILYHGPRNDLPKEYNPKGVISLLNNLSDKITCIRGNCDTEVDNLVLDFPVLSDTCIIHDGNTTIFAAHGHNFNESNLTNIGGCDILLNGHTHVQKITKYQNYTYINPGSVSIPKEGNTNTYMIFENNTFVIKSFDGEIIQSYKNEKASV